MTSDEITKEHVDKVRERALTKFSDNFENGLYDDRDVRRFKTDDDYVSTFMRGPERLDEAVDLVHESLKWRNEIQINDVTEDSFERWAWERGAIYFHNVDKDGHSILYFRVKEHKKGEHPTEFVKKFVAYWLESAFREQPHQQIVVLFDMGETGLSNLDMDLIKFVITSFKLYYPTLLAYILVYEMPWILSAAWKIIKSWLSAEAQARLKFVTKSDIQEYINKDQLLEHMGGTDMFKYEYIPPENRDASMSASRKRVTFADQDSSVYRSVSADSLNEECYNGIQKGKLTSSVRHRMTMNNSQASAMTASGSISGQGSTQHGSIHGSTQHGSVQGSAYQGSTQQGSMFSGHGGLHSSQGSMLSTQGSMLNTHSSMMSSDESNENCFIGRLLTIKPAEVLEFSAGDGSKEAFDIVFMTNSLPYPISFKVKTTSPEKYRVRPSYGVVKPGTCSKVFIYLHSEYQDGVHKDRFLIMAMEVTDESTMDNMSHLWKNAQKDSVMEHRLRCVYNPSARSPGRPPKEPKLSVEQHLVKISDQMQSVVMSTQRQECMIRCLLASVLLLYGMLGALLFVYILHPEWLNLTPGCKSILF